MARTTNEFGGGEIVPAIEAITGVQAPVMEDFVSALSTTGTNPTLNAADIVALQAMTVNNEHGQRRSIQNPKNNLKSNSGIERIPFNGIDELDTERSAEIVSGDGLGGRVVHALNTGDSRIRFVGSGWTFRVNNDGSRPSTDNTGDYIEVTFYGTGFNLLGRIDPNSTWTANLDGGADFVVLDDGSGSAPSDLSSVLNGQNVDANEIIPVTSGLTAGVHTIRIRRETDQLFLTGCEIINENAGITQQSGADFDGRVELLNGTDLPIIPTDFTGSTGARVLNYLTSGGQLNQVFTESVESVVEAGGQGTTYTVQLSTPGTTGTLTIPATAASVRVITFGGGSGGSSSGTGRINGFGGGGGARAEVVYTRNSGNTSTLALTSEIGAVGGSTTASLAATLVATAGGAGNSNGGSGGNPGSGGIANVPATDPGITGWTRTSTTEFNGNTGGSGGGGAGGAAGGVGGNTGVSVGITTGTIPLFPLTTTSEIAGRTEGSGGGQTSIGDPVSAITGAIPGGGGSGETSGSNPPPGAGARGETYVIYTLSSANAADPVTNGTFTSADAQAIGTPLQTFGNINHVEQEVIRRINFREFGANTQFATLAATGNQNAAFTLDDGTTTLVGSSVVGGTISTGVDRMSISATAGFFVLTFVGTGLDIFEGGIDGGTTIGSPQDVFVDGLNIGPYTPSTLPRITPIVSGLSYGTHTVRFLIPSTGANINPNVVDFIIYGPKKPEIPEADEGSLELSDYNIMADYVPVSTVDTNNAGGIFSGGTGILRKAQPREVLYAGSIDAFSFSTAHMNGIDAALNSGGSASYTFFGTGVDIRFALDGGLASDPSFLSIDIDGITDFSDTSVFTTSYYFTSAIDIGTGAAETDFNRSTGVVTNRNTNAGTNGGSGVSINGFPIGVHTVTITRTGGRDCHFSAFDVITPIHFQEDTLKVGSEGLNNLTVDPVVEEDEAVVLANRGEAKAWINYDPVNNIVLSSFNIAAALETTTNNSQLQVFFDKPFKDANYVALSQVLATSPGGTGNIVTNGFKQANFCRMQTESSADTFGIFAAFYGELIDE